ncbi:hypothetical protein [Mariniphaga sediminis]|nr:hypothetical protein [Mariniphaga sediminis]
MNSEISVGSLPHEMGRRKFSQGYWQQLFNALFLPEEMKTGWEREKEN